MLMLSSDPAVYPHLDIYPAITDVSEPVHPTPVLSMSNSTKTDIQLSPGYPSLVICESPSRKHGPKCSYTTSLQILRCTRGLTSILPLLVKLPGHYRQYPPANHGPGWLHMRARNNGSCSQPMRTRLQFRSCQTT